ncbi:hypothetical protein BC939DRAFT_130905 [Gamsiella multidivaricata]|uniref:uncharacterized protein n=1 Tax=Gamsiella multidivaricata TaxID=101098 RepID=UPI002221099E|nr:uncharacterized protein BC939DRAFT_130905 [Gamsiella multidivaricata]KAI7825140.1 hypothetical protein BC939DRAFT_130905 [Gamsiella multidivaricata]
MRVWAREGVVRVGRERRKEGRKEGRKEEKERKKREAGGKKRGPLTGAGEQVPHRISSLLSPSKGQCGHQGHRRVFTSSADMCTLPSVLLWVRLLSFIPADNRSLLLSSSTHSTYSRVYHTRTRVPPRPHPSILGQGTTPAASLLLSSSTLRSIRVCVSSFCVRVCPCVER